MARTPPGKTREKVYRYVRERLLAGMPPTVREVQQAMGFRAVESARGHLNALVAQGRLDRQPGRARGYALPRPEGAPTPLPTLVPLLGHVQAGDLQLALECPSGYVAVEANRHPPEGSKCPVDEAERGPEPIGSNTPLIRPGQHCICHQQSLSITKGLKGPKANLNSE